MWRKPRITGALVLERPDGEPEGGQLFAELVVHLARDSTPLVFLREDQT
jgi:hypothetical protein